MTEQLLLEEFAGKLAGVGSADVSAAARGKARDCLADALACAALGRRLPIYQHSVGALSEVFGETVATATAWFERSRQNPLLAAYLNSLAVSADDLDDGNRGAAGHPGGAVIPAVLAEIEAGELWDADILGAIVVGYEAGVRIARARSARRLATLATGRWAGFAAAAASCWLAGDGGEVLAAALAHAGSLAPQLVAPDARRPDGLKEGTPWGVVAGLSAARLARAGIDAPTYLLEVHPDFEPPAVDSVPGGAPAIEQTYFKRYACCRWIHPVIDALTALHSTEPLDISGIDRIDVVTFSRGLTLTNHPQPRSLEEAHYSFPFCAALSLVRGAEALLPITPDSLADERVLGLAARVSLRADPVLDCSFPARTPAVVRVHTTAGIREMSVDTAQGDPALPFAPGVMQAKCRTLQRSLPARQALALDTVLKGPEIRAKELAAALRPGGD